MFYPGSKYMAMTHTEFILINGDNFGPIVDLLGRKSKPKSAIFCAFVCRDSSIKKFDVFAANNDWFKVLRAFEKTKDATRVNMTMATCHLSKTDISNIITLIDLDGPIHEVSIQCRGLFPLRKIKVVPPVGISAYLDTLEWIPKDEPGISPDPSVPSVSSVPLDAKGAKGSKGSETPKLLSVDSPTFKPSDLSASAQSFELSNLSAYASTFIPGDHIS